MIFSSELVLTSNETNVDYTDTQKDYSAQFVGTSDSKNDHCPG
jgi:hypothetical protein